MKLISLDNIANTILSGLDSLFTSDEERLAAKQKLQETLNQPHLLQALTNLEEAKHPSLWVSGWRPGLGWLCVGLLAYAWILRDFIVIGLSLANRPDVVAMLPTIETSELMTLVFTLLGLGAQRTAEKLKGVARQR
ncbi:3TM-type holin [Spartinivicinus ruber]|uniref:3TM-type holin n=1 Tax=Spartinivicinus ruber TaxID=2683272 RepID=UPI0013D5B5C3|nr:3TM-type holin [Spartinivicinus ruber]